MVGKRGGHQNPKENGSNFLKQLHVCVTMIHKIKHIKSSTGRNVKMQSLSMVNTQ